VKPRTDPSAERLEQLWAGDFGNEYTERNRGSIDRSAFWSALFEAHRFRTALEVGCNVGDNLLALRELIGEEALAGVDVNEGALAVARRALPRADLRRATAKQLPFADGSFELVFTAMVLIHQPDETLGDVMSEIVRCSSRYVLTAEYESPDSAEVLYRGQHGALFKRPYADLYLTTFPELRRVGGGFLGRADGWDDVTWVLLERQPHA
jgi:pseudaminic acid biosynthesis-associated methylase